MGLKSIFLVVLVLLMTVGTASSLIAPHPADTNGDGCVDIAEIATYVKLWKDGFLPISDVVIGVEVWKLGCDGGSGDTCWVVKTLSPTDDAYVDAANPSQNFGQDASLRVDKSPDIYETYLKFSLPANDGVGDAKLRIRVESSGTGDSDNGGTVYVAGSSWNENSITDSNKPSRSGSGITQGAVGLGQWAEWDVSNIINSNGIISLALIPVSNNGGDYDSKETSNKPELVAKVKIADPSCASCVDNDNDGYGTGCLGGLDCNDNDPNVYQALNCNYNGNSCGSYSLCVSSCPASPVEVCDDGIDNDCDGIADEGCGGGSGDIVIAAAGDIASSSNKDAETAAIISSINPDYVLIPGDLAYNDGSPSQFRNYYDPDWGKFYDITFPSPGNHEYKTSGASGYFGYWESRFNQLGVNPSYYSYDIGNWRIVSLNAELSGTERRKQAAWMINDLANSNQPCSLAFWHQPRFSSNKHGGVSYMDTFWDASYDAGVDVVLNGHDHGYERFVPMGKNGNADSNGPTEFVVGTGGKSSYSFKSIKSTSVTHYKGYGVLKMVLKDGSFDYEFISVPGSYSDSGSGTCSSKI